MILEAVESYPQIIIASEMRVMRVVTRSDTLLKPSVRGTRITVGEVLGFLAAGGSEAELIEDFPQLTHEDILACLGFAAERERRLLVLPAA